MSLPTRPFRNYESARSFASGGIDCLISSYIVVQGADVFCRDEGAGPGVILGHSSTDSGGQWRSIIERLAGRYRLVAPDHLGYGRTSPYSGDVPLWEHEIAIISALVDFLGGPVHLVGRSFGGAVMARVAIRRADKVRTLTLFEPTLFHLLAPAGRIGEHQEIRAVAERVVRFVDAGDPREAARGFIDYWVGDGAFAAMDERVRSSVVAGMTKLRAEWLSAFEAGDATTEALAAAPMPIQLVCGARTTPAARAVIEILRNVWPRAEFTAIAGAGHMAPVTHGDFVNPIVDEFLRAGDGRPAE